MSKHLSGELPPDWSEGEKAEGEKFKEAWDEFLSAADEGSAEMPEGLGPGGGDARISEVRNRHESALLKYPNVVGLGEGIRSREGKPTSEPCIVVYVGRKVPESELKEDEILPAEIEGVPVDVLEVGEIRPLTI